MIQLSPMTEADMTIEKKINKPVIKPSETVRLHVDKNGNVIALPYPVTVSKGG